MYCGHVLHNGCRGARRPSCDSFRNYVLGKNTYNRTSEPLGSLDHRFCGHPVHIVGIWLSPYFWGFLLACLYHLRLYRRRQSLHHRQADLRRLVAHHPIHYAHLQVDPYHHLYARDYYPFGREFGFCPAVLVPPSNRVGRVVFLLDGEFVHFCDGLLYKA